MRIAIQNSIYSRLVFVINPTHPADDNDNNNDHKRARIIILREMQNEHENRSRATDDEYFRLTRQEIND